MIFRCLGILDEISRERYTILESNPNATLSIEINPETFHHLATLPYYQSYSIIKTIFGMKIIQTTKVDRFRIKIK